MPNILHKFHNSARPFYLLGPKSFTAGMQYFTQQIENCHCAHHSSFHSCALTMNVSDAGNVIIAVLGLGGFTGSKLSLYLC